MREYNYDSNYPNNQFIAYNKSFKGLLNLFLYYQVKILHYKYIRLDFLSNFLSLFKLLKRFPYPKNLFLSIVLIN